MVWAQPPEGLPVPVKVMPADMGGIKAATTAAEAEAALLKPGQMPVAQMAMVKVVTASSHLFPVPL